jgi:hypothetical protein
VTVVTCTASDAAGNTASASFRVITNLPPDCDHAVSSVGNILWPPDHKTIPVTISVPDADGDHVKVTITAIRQDEPTNARGDGNTCPDGTGIGTDTAQIRSERTGLGDGRVYRILFTADDGRGATCTGVVGICVPHDQAHLECGDEGALYDSTSCN